MMTVLKDRSTKGHISGLELLDLLVIDVNVPAYILMNLYGIWKRGGGGGEIWCTQIHVHIVRVVHILAPSVNVIESL